MSKAAYLLLDRSGSMASCQELITSGINDFISTLRTDPNGRDARFLMTTFDSQGFDIVRRGDIAEVTPLGPKEFEPRALTPLYDAVAHAIDDLDKAGTERRMLIVVTDGEENASRTHNAASVKALLADRQSKGWIVIYLAAHVDAWKQAGAIGIPEARAMNFKAAPVPVARTGFFGRIFGGTTSVNPFAVALGAAAGVGLAHMLLSGSQASATNASASGFSDSDRNAAMGVDGSSETWQDAVAADVGSFGEPFATAADLPPELAAIEAGLPGDFDPSQGSVDADGNQPGPVTDDVLSDFSDEAFTDAEAEATSGGGNFDNDSSDTGSDSGGWSDAGSSSSSDD
jgi:uncharacterized protein YegL